MKKKTYIQIFLVAFVFCFSAGLVKADNYVETSQAKDLSGRKATFTGLTASSTATGETVTVYFEYGAGSSNLSSSTLPKSLSSGTLTSSNQYRKFEAEVTDLIPGTYNYYRIVRKVVPTSGETKFYRGQISYIEVERANTAPIISSFLSMSQSFPTSNCDEEGCTIEIPENLPSYTAIAELQKFDPEGDLMSLYIKSGNTDGAFELSPLGSLSVARKEALDFEENDDFTLIVEVKDYGPGRLASTYEVVVKLKNIENESTPLPTSYIPDPGNPASSYSYTYNPTSGNTVNYGPTNTARATSYTYNPRTTSNSSTANYQVTVGNSVPYSYNSTGIHNNSSNVSVQMNPALQNNPQLQAFVQSILAQIAILQQELNERIRLGLP